MLLFYIRHGDPIYEPNSLTPLGRRQAEAVGRRLARYGLDEIYTSSSARAQQTAQPTCEMLHMGAAVLDWTNEDHAWAEMSVPLPDGGRTWAFYTPQVRDAFTAKEIRNAGDGWIEHPAFEGMDFVKGYLRIRGETRAFLEKLGFQWDDERGQYRNLNGRVERGAFGKRVALFAHHGFGTCFLSSVLDIPYPEVCIKTGLSHSNMTVIHFDERNEYIVPRMLTMSNDGHLLADGLPTRYDNIIPF